MNSAIEQRASLRPHTIVLLARLVDRDGNAIGPADIRSIECTVYRVDDAGVPHRCDDLELDTQSLRVAEVIDNDWQHAGDWTASGEPFNFRHELPAPSDTIGAGAATRFEIRYLIMQTTGECTVVRFHIRNNGHDRRGTDSFDSQPIARSAR